MTGQGRVPVSTARVPSGVREGGRFRAAVREEAPVNLGESALNAGLPRPAELAASGDLAAAVPDLDDEIVWHDR